MFASNTHANVHEARVQRIVPINASISGNVEPIESQRGCESSKALLPYSPCLFLEGKIVYRFGIYIANRPRPLNPVPQGETNSKHWDGDAYICSH